MPYIDPKLRPPLDKDLASLAAQIATTGELNYCITRLAVLYLARIGGGKPNYAQREQVHGTLSCARAEFYRRVLSDYEFAKCVQNGDVYGEIET